MYIYISYRLLAYYLRRILRKLNPPTIPFGLTSISSSSMISIQFTPTIVGNLRIHKKTKKTKKNLIAFFWVYFIPFWKSQQKSFSKVTLFFFSFCQQVQNLTILWQKKRRNPGQNGLVQTDHCPFLAFNPMTRFTLNESLSLVDTPGISCKQKTESPLDYHAALTLWLPND